MSKIGRNDPCPCGTGKKYKNCCMQRPQATGKKKFKATLLSGKKIEQEDNEPVNLFERTYGSAIASTFKQELAPSDPKVEEKEQ